MAEKRILAIIPARGGSKGLPGKNIKDLHGVPMLARTINAALNSRYKIDTFVSTDDDEIKQVALDFGAQVPFVRPSEFATDTASVADAVLHFIGKVEQEYDSLVLLQPTSPLRNEKHIDEALELHFKNERPVVSVVEADKSPHWMYKCENQKLIPFIQSYKQHIQRQALEKAYCLNGAIYVVNIVQLKENNKFVFDDSIPYLMDRASSIDIDTIIDFKLAELILSEL